MIAEKLLVLEGKQCNYCGHKYAYIYKDTTGHHGCGVRCSHCDTFIKWLNKYDSEKAINMGVIQKAKDEKRQLSLFA